MAGESGNSKKVKNVLKKNPWPPDINPKPKELGLPSKILEKGKETRQRMDEPIIAEPVEVSVQVAKETQTDDDGYLLPKSITDVQNFASDEYVKVDIEKESRKHDVTTTKENIVEVNSSVSSEIQHLHIHIHIGPSQTAQPNNRWRVSVLQAGADIGAPPPPPRTPPPPPRPPPKTYETGNEKSTASITKQEDQSEDSSDSSNDELDVTEILRGKPDRRQQKKPDYDEVNYGGNVQKDGDERKSSGGSNKEKNVPPQKETRPLWLFKYTETEEAEDSVQSDKDGSFAVIQENEDLMPCTPYSLIVVHNGQLKRLPFMKKEGKHGKEKYALGNSKFMKSIEELVAYFQTHEIGVLKLKLLTLK